MGAGSMRAATAQHGTNACADCRGPSHIAVPASQAHAAEAAGGLLAVPGKVEPGMALTAVETRLGGPARSETSQTVSYCLIGVTGFDPSVPRLPEGVFR
jgi:hypothetical protein